MCFGLANEKDIIIETVKRFSVEICWLQGTKINIGFLEEELKSSDYDVALEMNDTKKERGNIHQEFSTKQQYHEVPVCMMVVRRDWGLGQRASWPCMGFINIYGPFRPQGLESPEMFYIM